MKIKLSYILTASKQVLSRKNYFVAFLSLIILIFAVFISIPVFIIPANSFLLQLTIFTIRDYVLLAILSILTSLLIIMQIFSYRQTKLCSTGITAISGGSAVVAALFGTASCASCIALIFGFLGTGTIFFLIEKQWYIMITSFLILLLSIYLTSLSIGKNFEKCVK